MLDPDLIEPPLLPDGQPYASPMVCMSAYAEDAAGNQSYADADAGERCDGWNVYIRWDHPVDPEGEPFEITFDEDYPAYETARAIADQLAQALDTSVQEY